jgi:hypothetical protein
VRDVHPSDRQQARIRRGSAGTVTRFALAIETPGGESAKPSDQHPRPRISRSTGLAGQPEASCEAYRDIFTRRRWRAQGYLVRKGEQGTTITTWIVIPSRDEDGGAKPARHPKRIFVFCRHQVERAH